MSISNNSMNCGDDFTPAAENGEVNGDSISLDNDGQFDGNSESIADQQQLKEFREKFAKMEMELKMAKLELENKALEQKLKHQEMMGEQKALKEKVTKIEQEKEKNAIIPNLSTSEEMSVLIARIAELYRAKTIEASVASSSDLFGQVGNGKVNELEKEHEQRKQKAFQSELEKKLMEQIVTVQSKVDKMEMAHQQQKAIIGELEGQQKHQKQQGEKERNAFLAQINLLKDEQKKYLERINELEKQQKHLQQEKRTVEEQILQFQNNQKKLMRKINELDKEEQQKRMVFLNAQKNYWDATACDENLEISGDKCLTVHRTGNYGRGYVFAKHSILMNSNSSDIFYFEISVHKKKGGVTFGFAVNQEKTSLGYIYCGRTYVYDTNGCYKAIFANGSFRFPKEINDEYSYGVGDTVGIGVNSSFRQILFTKNGQRLDPSDLFVAPSFVGQLFPFISLGLSGDEIEANFGPDNFKFDLATLSRN